MFYIHNVHGRVRIFSEVIAKNPQAADEVRKGLSTFAGVCTVHINLTTGSILIHYNPKAVTVADIVDMLERKGYFDRTKAISNDEYFTNGLSRVGTTVVKTVIDTFIGRAVGNTFLSFLMFLL
ncbi:MAG TPA: cation transporter [Thermodesulfovibrionales bacterium]|nr:cation transporter [Thermodesulfovibrionales bacterium]